MMTLFRLDRYGSFIVSFLLFIMLAMVPGALRAQQFSVRQELDTNRILPGERIMMSIYVNREPDMKVQFPPIADSLPKGMEFLGLHLADSLNSNGLISLKYVTWLTSFDSGTYIIPPMKYIFTLGGKSDTLQTIPLFVDVQPVAIDPQKDIYDIKPPLQAPLPVLEIIFWTLLAIFLSMLITIIWLLIRRKRRKQPLIRTFRPAEPPDVIALRSLDELKELKLWQQGKTKEYYIQLTEIVRLYIEQRFSVPALEQTSAEILESLKFTAHDDESTYFALKQLLDLADLVKFAKALPLPDDNEGNLLNAYVFVNRTKSQPAAVNKTYEDSEPANS